MSNYCCLTGRAGGSPNGLARTSHQISAKVFMTHYTRSDRRDILEFVAYLMAGVSWIFRKIPSGLKEMRLDSEIYGPFAQDIFVKMGHAVDRAIRVVIFLAVTLFVLRNQLSFAGNELNDEFALKNGPRFELPEQQQDIVDRVIAEFKRGYGGTLVVSPGPDKALDSSAFLSRYLREFASLDPDGGLKTYDYRFERILARVSTYPVTIDDPRLDWDIWRSVLAYENFSDGTDTYKEGPRYEGDSPSVYEVESAKDLAWMYINRHADDLMKDGDRLQWWVDHLVSGLNEPDRSRVHRWFLLQLCALADPHQMPQLPPAPNPPPAPGESPEKPMRKPSPEDPFLVVQEDAKPPSFEEALHKIAGPLGISFEVWGIDPLKMFSARILPVKLEMVKWPTGMSFIIGQESWSDPEKGSYEWGVHFFRITGRRASYSNVSIPQDRKDGVFFFPFNRRLYVWPKAEMDAGVLQMLHVAGLIDDATWTRLVEACGFHKLKTTLIGE